MSNQAAYNRGASVPGITILGLGNPILKDDGIGPRVVQELQKEGLPHGVNAVTAGGSFNQCWDILAGSKYVIAVDSLLGGGPPGTVYLLRPEEIDREIDAGVFRHEDDFLGVLDLMACCGIRPEVIIVGVEPKEITYSLDLSPEILERIPDVTGIVREQCAILMRDGNFSAVNNTFPGVEE
ncbi:MAG: hydrogenase maturation protease [Bacillota bacterium]